MIKVINSEVTLNFKNGDKFIYDCHPSEKPTLRDGVVTVPNGENKYKELWASNLDSIDFIDEVE